MPRCPGGFVPLAWHRPFRYTLGWKAMKTLLFLALLAGCLPGHSLGRDIGVLAGTEKEPPAKGDVTVGYVYDGRGQLFLTVRNIAMDAATRGVTGTIAVHPAAILIHPKERFDTDGPAESPHWFTVRYVIPNVKPGIYTLVHDDTATEGTDRVTRTVLDLSKATKGSVTVPFRDPVTKPQPAAPAEPSPRIDPEAIVPAE
jgi:hypothetical protein